ncbi:hypothetical protein IWW45_001026 [Coemansia sp. RSA 485]|nr:hypothetical protein IWW45_001026 [Coemansia sp. RSA 485]
MSAPTVTITPPPPTALFFESPCICQQQQQQQTSTSPSLFKTNIDTQLQPETTTLKFAFAKCSRLQHVLGLMLQTLQLSKATWQHIHALEIGLLPQPTCESFGDWQTTIQEQDTVAFKQAFPNVTELAVDLEIDKPDSELAPECIDGLTGFSQLLATMYCDKLCRLQCNAAIGLENKCRFDNLKELRLNAANVPASRLFACLNLRTLTDLALQNLHPWFDWTVLNRLTSPRAEPLQNITSLAIEYIEHPDSLVAETTRYSQRNTPRTRFVFRKLFSLEISNYPDCANFFSTTGCLGHLQYAQYSGTISGFQSFYGSLVSVGSLAIRITEIPMRHQKMFYDITNNLFGPRTDTTRCIVIENDADLFIMDSRFALDMNKTRWTRITRLLIHAAVNYRDITRGIVKKNPVLQSLGLFQVRITNDEISNARAKRNSSDGFKHKGSCLTSKLKHLAVGFARTDYASDNFEYLCNNLVDMVMAFKYLRELDLQACVFRECCVGEVFGQHIVSEEIACRFID